VRDGDVGEEDETLSSDHKEEKRTRLQVTVENISKRHVDQTLPERIMEQFNLNEKQRVVLWSVANVLISELYGRPTRQMLFFVGGVAGTGKSHCVLAIRAMFAAYGVGKRFVPTAVMGVQANALGGHTIGAVTKQRRGGRSRNRGTRARTDADVEKVDGRPAAIVIGALMLLCDEVRLYLMNCTLQSALRSRSQ
jgi:hypothetical protein